MNLNQFNIGWWSCFISMYYNSIGTKSNEVIDLIINTAKDAKITQNEIDDIIDIIQFYGNDGLNEEVLNFLNRLKNFI